MQSKRLISRSNHVSLHVTRDHNCEGSRRDALKSFASVLAGGALAGLPSRAHALVKGVAPPPKKSASDKPKCTNV